MYNKEANMTTVAFGYFVRLTAFCSQEHWHSPVKVIVNSPNPGAKTRCVLEKKHAEKIGSDLVDRLRERERVCVVGGGGGGGGGERMKEG